MNRRPVPVICIVLAFSLTGIAGAANYMYEKASVQGTGYKELERIGAVMTEMYT